MDIGFHFDRGSERGKGDNFERKIEELQKYKISTGTINVKYVRADPTKCEFLLRACRN